jgi:hypothetical protein
MPRYAPSSAPYTEDIGQLERWLGTETQQIRGSTDDIYTLARFAIENFVIASYLAMKGAATAIGTVAAAWVTVPCWTAVAVNGGAPLLQGSIPNGVTAIGKGDWQISCSINFSFVEANASRRLSFRFYDVTLGAPMGAGWIVGVGRNVDVVNVVITGIAQIAASEAAPRTFVLQMSSPADTFSTVAVLDGYWSFASVGKYEGDSPIAQYLQG